MISDRMIAKCIEEAAAVAGIDLMAANSRGELIAKTASMVNVDREEILDLINGDEDERQTKEYKMIRILEGERNACVLIATPGPGGYVSADLIALQLKNLAEAGTDKVDRDSFFQNLLLDNLLTVDIYNRAKKLHVDAAQRRCVFIIEPVAARDDNLIKMVRELFYTEAGDHVTAVDEGHVVVIRALSDDEGADELFETAQMLVDMAGSEALSDVRVSYGTLTQDIKGVPRSYKEAKMALDVSRIFYPLKRTIDYSNLGVGRLIYQLPVNLCKLFVKEIFGDDIPEEIDDEVLATVNKFFDNSLNVSETSRQLFIHRNTLIYRIEKLQKATGLDVRVFDDALTLKIALMVVNYMKYVESET